MTTNAQMTNSPRRANPVISLFSDIRFLQAVGQVIFLIIVVALLSALISSIFTELARKNLTPNFSFLENRAGFDISEGPDWYTSNSNYGEAFVVGVLNTLRVVVAGLVLTTILGILVGIFLLSSNWLVRNISRVYVEILRNTPLLVQLFFWYFIVMLSLPSLSQAFTVPSEGVVLFPLRIFLYILAYVIIRRSVRHDELAAPRRRLRLFGFYAAVVTFEFAMLLAATAPYYGSGDLLTAPFLAYVAISVGVIAALQQFALPALKWQLTGLAVGQLIGGLLFYFGIIPTAGIRLELYPAVYITVRGIIFPEFIATARFTEWIVFVVIGVVLAVLLWGYFSRITETTGQQFPLTLLALASIIGFAVGGWLFVGIEPAFPPATVSVDQEGTVVQLPFDEARAQGLLPPEQIRTYEQQYSTQPLLVILPTVRRNRVGIINGFDTGSTVTPEYMALLLGLVVYTSAFIAEIVRAGILAVPRGQIEASRALGFTTPQTLQRIILPQALRVIIPPLGNQYLNLSKNSSLAVALAYADVVLVTQTIMNQSGQSVTGIMMIMVDRKSVV